MGADLVTIWNDSGLPQGRVTNGVSKQQHLGWSDELKLEWLSEQVVGDHDE